MTKTKWHFYSSLRGFSLVQAGEGESPKRSNLKEMMKGGRRNV